MECTSLVSWHVTKGTKMRVILPGEDFDLAGRVEDDVITASALTIDEVQDLQWTTFEPSAPV